MGSQSPLLPRVAEFFAGIGLVRMALEFAGCRVVFANDNDSKKAKLYAANFDSSVFFHGDVRDIRGADVPDIEIATASFPCTDLSLAGNRAGLNGGAESSILAEFLRVLAEMGDKRKPIAVLLENVLGFATSNGGEDLRLTVENLNRLGYVCDILTLDARRFVPQSRPRLFIVGFTANAAKISEWMPSDLHPAWILKFAQRHPNLSLVAAPLPNPPPKSGQTLADVVERFRPMDVAWWDVSRLGAFLASLSSTNVDRLESLRQPERLNYATAYRRTRGGKPVWEIRADTISGCLRTARGGSSKQAVVEAGFGDVRVRWMTAIEYARLQGAPYFSFGQATQSEAKFALGDAVCVPVVAWLAEHYLVPLVRENLSESAAEPILAYA